MAVPQGAWGAFKKKKKNVFLFPQFSPKIITNVLKLDQM